MNPLYQLAAQLLMAFAVLLIGGIIGKLVEKTVGRTLHELELNILFRRMLGTKVMLEELLSGAAKWLIYVMTLLIALKQLGIENIVLYTLLGSILLFCLIGLLLGLRDFIPNAVSGLLLYKRGTITEGDIIKVKDIEGRVKSITLVQTILETKNKDSIYIPNAALVREFWKKKK
ncbi:mechanosensitive ion channel [Candidatus Woesearchaeota archaeon]|nr:mechanosensitive ion channel [Candidatus Woesearchaeota archaeon]